MDGNEMGLTTRHLQMPHYYEVVDEDGKRYCHCGSMKSVNRILESHPRFNYHLCFFAIPQTVNVSHTSVQDKELNPQKILPENQQQPLDL